MLEKLIISPVTGSENTRLAARIMAKDIVRLYKADIGINVERLFADNKYIYIYQCDDTGYRFYYPFSIIGDPRFYQDLLEAKVEKGHSFYTTIRFEHKFAIKKVFEKAKVLDIGCGEGYFLEAIKDRASIYGLEFYDKAIEICLSKGIKVYKETIEEHDKSEYYDIVTAFQVLEHVSDISSFIRNAIKVLKKGGKLIIAVPNNNPYYQRNNKYSALNLPPHHMGLWNKSSLKKMGDHFGLLLKDISYNKPVSLKVDAYLMAKKWINIKNSFLHLSNFEKFKIALLLPITFLLSSFHYLTRKVEGDSIVVEFEY